MYGMIITVSHEYTDCIFYQSNKNPILMYIFFKNKELNTLLVINQKVHASLQKTNHQNPYTPLNKIFKII